MIVADTGAVIALVDADDRHHESLQALFETDPGAWGGVAAILRSSARSFIHGRLLPQAARAQKCSRSRSRSRLSRPREAMREAMRDAAG